MKGGGVCHLRYDRAMDGPCSWVSGTAVERSDIDLESVNVERKREIVRAGREL